jgi:gliding motility-associated-like protein
MRVVVILLCSFFLIDVHNGYGQNPVIQWQKIYGGPYGDYAHAIRATTDGGYIVAGYTEGNGGNVAGYHGNLFINDYWVMKLDRDGQMEWQRCIGGTYTEQGADVRQTPDGGYLVAGISASIECELEGNKGALDYWVVKLSPKGDILWQKHYGGGNHEYCYGLDLTSDGGFVVAGHTESFNGDVTNPRGKRDYWVVKADANGNMLWQKTAGGTEDDEAYAVKATPDGGCVVAGLSFSNNGDVTGNHGKADMWVIKLDNTGNLEWQKSLGGLEMEQAWSINLATDGGYIVTGYTTSSDGDVTNKHAMGFASADCWVVKLSPAGALQWQKCYGGSKNEFVFDLQPTPDGGYVIGGFAQSDDGDLTCNAGDHDMWVFKISNLGVLQWQKNMGGSLYDEVYGVTVLNDGSVVAAGISCSPNVYGQTQQTNPFGTCGDFWIVKLAPFVASEPPPVVTVSPSSGMFCVGRSTVFTASVQYGGTNPQFQWTRNGTPVGTNSHKWTGTNLADNDVIACRVTSGGACYSGMQQSTGSVTVKVNSTLTVPQLNVTASSTVVCDCDAKTFTASVIRGGSSPAFLWKVNDQYTGVNSEIFTSSSLKAGDKVTCVYADASICIPGDSIDYTITLTGGAGQAPSVSILASSNPVCTGALVTFNATPSNAGINPSYQWKVNGVNAGTNSASFATAALANGDVVTCTITKDPTYTCVSAQNATSNSIIMNISNGSSPTVNVTATATNICIGTSVTFTANAANAGTNPSYEWKFNGVHVGGNTKTLTTNAIANGDIVSCDIIVDPGYTCTNIDRASSNNINMTVIMQMPPVATVAVTGNDVCAGNNVHFTVTTQNAGTNPGYQWMVNGVAANSTSASFNSNTLKNGDEVYCMITPAQGVCSSTPVSSDKVVAIIHPVPQISISPADTVIKAGYQVQFRVSATNASNFAWTPHDKLVNSAVFNAQTIPLTANTTYVLNVGTSMGCQASATAVVRVGRPLVMPNAFTPNNDGSNDVFRIPPAVLLDLKEFSIFDRWGNKIFTTKDISKGWDGSFNNQKLNAGVYVYMITGNTEQGKVTVKGTVNLVR